MIIFPRRVHMPARLAGFQAAAKCVRATGEGTEEENEGRTKLIKIKIEKKKNNNNKNKNANRGSRRRIGKVEGEGPSGARHAESEEGERSREQGGSTLERGVKDRENPESWTKMNIQMCTEKARGRGKEICTPMVPPMGGVYR